MPVFQSITGDVLQFEIILRHNQKFQSTFFFLKTYAFLSTFALYRLIEPERRASLLDPLTKAFGNFSFTAKSVGDLVKSHEEPAFGNIKTESSDRG